MKHGFISFKKAWDASDVFFHPLKLIGYPAGIFLLMSYHFDA
jgi:hypothetical protein